MMPRLYLFVIIFVVGTFTIFGQERDPIEHNLMPVPASFFFKSGRLTVSSALTVTIKGYSDTRLQSAIDRAMRRLEARTGLTLARGLIKDESAATFVIRCAGPGKPIPSVDEDESYSLEVSTSQAVLDAPTVVGVVRGLDTFLQLLGGDKGGYFIHAVKVQDRPRFPWRGLMIDVCRHWQPMEVIKRNLDAMAAVKLNVLHLHLTEDQGFRIESKKYPELHEKGSDGLYFTQEQMREIIEYARMRGIRVIPEFDMPGHATSWLVSHPELGSQPGPYQIEHRWGVFDPALDPTNEALYKMLDGFLGEMAKLFPDPYIHIGGDENEGKHWNANPKIQGFIKARGLKDNHGLQGYFNRRTLEILRKYGKKMIGWDEILHPDLPKDIVVQSWRGQQSLADGAKKGYQGILSNGYYIDLIQPGWQHYLNDPIPTNTNLVSEEQKLILGGEATMWSEWVSPETIDSRIWPRTTAIAERFWSPNDIKNVDDMYRRLAVMSVRLEEYGLLHEKNYGLMLRRLAGPLGANENAVATIKNLVDILEPVKGYKRGTMQNATQQTPLTRLADTARPDSAKAREFARMIDAWLYAATAFERSGAVYLKDHFTDWQSAARSIETEYIENSPLLAEALPLARDLNEISEIGRNAVEYLSSGKVAPDEWRKAVLILLDKAAQPKSAVELVVIQPIRELVIAAAEQEKRKSLSATEWKKTINEMAAPK